MRGLRLIAGEITLNANTLLFAVFAVCLLLCLEVVIFYFLAHRISEAKQEKEQQENKQQNDELHSFINPFLLVAGSATLTRSFTVLMVLSIVALCGFIGILVLLLYATSKGYLIAPQKKAVVRRIPEDIFAEDNEAEEDDLTEAENPIVVADTKPENIDENEVSKVFPAHELPGYRPVFHDYNGMRIVEKNTKETVRETIIKQGISQETADRLLTAIEKLLSENKEDRTTDLQTAVAPFADLAEEDIEDNEMSDAEEDTATEESEQQSSDEQGFTAFGAGEKIIGFDEETGCYILARYKKSFRARLILAKPEVKANYSAVKNVFLSYEGVDSRIYWNGETIFYHKTPLAKIVVRESSLDVYYALNPDVMASTAYHGDDVTEKKKYAETPFLFRINSQRKATLGEELAQRVCEDMGLVSIDVLPVDYGAEFPFESLDSLIQRGLVKEYIREQKPTVSFELAEEDRANDTPTQPDESQGAAFLPDVTTATKEENPIAENREEPIDEVKETSTDETTIEPQEESEEKTEEVSEEESPDKTDSFLPAQFDIADEAESEPSESENMTTEQDQIAESDASESSENPTEAENVDSEDVPSDDTDGSNDLVDTEETEPTTSELPDEAEQEEQNEAETQEEPAVEAQDEQEVQEESIDEAPTDDSESEESSYASLENALQEAREELTTEPSEQFNETVTEEIAYFDEYGNRIDPSQLDFSNLEMRDEDGNLVTPDLFAEMVGVKPENTEDFEETVIPEETETVEEELQAPKYSEMDTIEDAKEDIPVEENVYYLNENNEPDSPDNYTEYLIEDHTDPSGTVTITDETGREVVPNETEDTQESDDLQDETSESDFMQSEPFTEEIPVAPVSHENEDGTLPKNLSILPGICKFDICELQEYFNDGDTVSLETLQGKGIIGTEYSVLKIDASGRLDKKLSVEASHFSRSAISAISEADGDAIMLR